MNLNIITDAYEYEIDCLVCDCKTTGALETLKIVEAQYLGERELFDRIIFGTPYGEERTELLELFAKKEREFYAAKDEAFQRLSKV